MDKYFYFVFYNGNDIILRKALKPYDVDNLPWWSQYPNGIKRFGNLWNSGYYISKNVYDSIKIAMINKKLSVVECESIRTGQPLGLKTVEF